MPEKGFEIRQSAILTPEERASMIKKHEKTKRAKTVKEIRDQRSASKGTADYRTDAPKGFVQPKEQVNFNVSTIGEITGEKFPLGEGGAAYETKKAAKSQRKASKQRFIANRENQKSLAEKAKSRSANDMEQKLQAHNRGLFAADVWHAEHRAKATAKQLETTQSLDPTKRMPGARINESHEDASSFVRRFEGLRMSQHTPQETGEVMAFSKRAKGAVLPPPHPKSLASKAKFSPKAKRDAWRAKAAGAAPRTVETDLHASDRMNKAWNKVKAIEPGELPDLD